MHHDAPVRTTLTLDADVARMIAAEVHRVRKPLKQVVNAALRRGLSWPGHQRMGKPYRLRPHKARLLPGLDRGRLNALADEQEDAVLAARARARKSA